MSHGALYNEIDPFAADWLDNLIAAGHIAPGRVERRSITELKPADVAGPGQRHFFAGIGGWSYALRLAGVLDNEDVWTGSCPCQPFSAAGARRGTSDPRHLWPAWFALIEQCRPAVIFGEQVASADGLVWLDLVFADLERCGYAVGAADLCAASVGAPHIRQRLYFVAHADRERLEGIRLRLRQRAARPDLSQASRGGPTGFVADADPTRRKGRDTGPERAGFTGAGTTGGLGDPGGNGDFEHAGIVSGDESEHALGVAHGDHTSVIAGATRGAYNGFWHPCDWIPCTDGVARPVEPGTFPLAHGAAARVGRLRAYGNAIVPQVAATFIEAAFAARRSLK